MFWIQYVPACCTTEGWITYPRSFNILITIRNALVSNELRDRMKYAIFINELSSLTLIENAGTKLTIIDRYVPTLGTNGE